MSIRSLASQFKGVMRNAAVASGYMRPDSTAPKREPRPMPTGLAAYDPVAGYYWEGGREGGENQ